MPKKSNSNGMLTHVIENYLSARRPTSKMDFQAGGFKWCSVMDTLMICSKLSIFFHIRPKFEFLPEGYELEGHYRTILSNGKEFEGHFEFPRGYVFKTLCLKEYYKKHLTSSGNLEVQFEVFVEKIIKGNIRYFNFHDPLKTEKFFTFEFESRRGSLYSNDQMLIHHSPVLASMIQIGQRKMPVVLGEKFKNYQNFLQIIHGVRDNLNESEILQILPIATDFKAHTVTRTCEYRLMQIMDSERLLDYLDVAIWYQLRHLFHWILKQLKSMEELKIALKPRIDVEKMSGEEMKALAGRFFELDVNK